jgi:hypothetical protein
MNIAGAMLTDRKGPLQLEPNFNLLSLTKWGRLERWARVVLDP